MEGNAGFARGRRSRRPWRFAGLTSWKARCVPERTTGCRGSAADSISVYSNSGCALVRRCCLVLRDRGHDAFMKQTLRPVALSVYEPKRMQQLGSGGKSQNVSHSACGRCAKGTARRQLATAKLSCRNSVVAGAHRRRGEVGQMENRHSHSDVELRSLAGRAGSAITIREFRRIGES